MAGFTTSIKSVNSGTLDVSYDIINLSGNVYLPLASSCLGKIFYIIPAYGASNYTV